MTTRTTEGGPETGTGKYERRSSHVFILDVPACHKPLMITDVAVNIAPALEGKCDILQNAIDFPHALGNERHRVAILSAVETINPKIPTTLLPWR